jgi:hypothetical protein
MSDQLEPEDTCRPVEIERAAMAKYPYQDGEVTVLGPEIFASGGGQAISWKGENYVSQSAPSCPDPIECGHEAALGQAEAAIERVRGVHRPASDWSWKPLGCQHDGEHSAPCRGCRGECWPCPTIAALAEPAPVGKPTVVDDYEQTTGHTITCTAAFTGVCDCPADTDPGDLAGYAMPDPPINCLTLTTAAPAAVVEVRDPCPYCEDCRLIPRHAKADHIRDIHPEIAR